MKHGETAEREDESQAVKGGGRLVGGFAVAGPDAQADRWHSGVLWQSRLQRAHGGKVCASQSYLQLSFLVLSTSGAKTTSLPECLSPLTGRPQVCYHQIELRLQSAIVKYFETQKWSLSGSGCYFQPRCE